MSEVILVKLVTSDFVIGMNDEVMNVIKEPAIVQIMPQGQSLSIALLPFGFPFEDEVTGFISKSHVIYQVKDIPGELLDKYTEAKSNIKIAKPSNDGKIIL